ncbi:MAG: hypothetical protein JOY54_16690 [Acidobacteriaceae bacterium]|nr:hypothetical protein [Acidobacteriaceae bacterium]
MNRPLNRIGFAILAVVVSMSASHAAAQQATFHLPVTAHWGQAVLQPGDYKMTSPEPALGSSTFFVRGADMAAYTLPLTTEDRRASSSSYLQLVKVDGTYFVEEYNDGSAGKLFTFALPKAARRQTIAHASGPVVAVTQSALR